MNRILLGIEECVALLLDMVADTRDQLQAATAKTVIDRFDVKVRIRPDVVASGCCTVAGTYFHGPPRITAAESTTPRRIAFTILHELAHHLIRRSYQFSWLARDPDSEERICNRFAAEILVPSALVASIVTAGRPRADEIVALHRASFGSGAVCARSASELLAEPGYVVVAVDNVITYAVSADVLVDLERDVLQPPDSLFAVALHNGAAAGTTQLIHRPGHFTGPLEGDVSLGDDNLMFGVFVERRQ